MNKNEQTVSRKRKNTMEVYVVTETEYEGVEPYTSVVAVFDNAQVASDYYHKMSLSYSMYSYGLSRRILNNALRTPKKGSLS